MAVYILTHFLQNPRLPGRVWSLQLANYWGHYPFSKIIGGKCPRTTVIYAYVCYRIFGRCCSFTKEFFITRRDK